MTDQSSSLVNTRGIVPAWRDVARFTIRPRLPETISGISSGALLATLKLYLLDMVLMGIALLAFLAVEGAGIELPSNELESIDLNLGMIFFIVVLAPVMEEFAFRGCLSGRPAHLLAYLSVLIGFGAFYSISTNGDLYGLPFLIVGLAGAVALLVVLHGRPAWRWFAKAFPLFFWLSTLGFAAIHLGNYADTDQMLWPLVIPQFLAGILFAYARVHHGLWSSILLHLLHNGTFVLLVLAGEGLAAA